MMNFNITDFRFDAIDQKNVAIIDATTVLDLCSADIFSALTLPLDDKFSALELDGILRVVYTTNSSIQETASSTLPNLAPFAAALNILERMCVHDCLLVDVNALESLSHNINPVKMEAFSKVLHTICIPDDTYNQVARRIQSYINVLESWNIPSVLKGVFPNWQSHMENEKVLEHGGDKPYQDFLLKQRLNSDCPALASSNQTAPRTLFYLELAHVAGCPVFLSPRKWQSFPYLREHLQNDLYKAIESIFESQLIESAKGRLEKDFGLRISVPGPPLLRLIVDNARSRNLSLLESTLEIRSQSEAEEFRKMIFDLQKYIICGGSSLIQLNRRLSELEKIATTWYEKGIGFSTRVETRTMELEAIPAIGWLFKVLSIGKVDFKLPRWKPSPKYLTFISSWYQP